MPITYFTQLRTWQKARDFAVAVYTTTDKFPQKELYGMSSQLRRSSVSISANVAEGFSRKTAKDKNQFYTIAIGSLTETMSHLFVAEKLGYCDQHDLQWYIAESEDLSKMLYGMIKSSQERRM
ncbi:MAG: four helix bundle protein [Candidatus Saccharimonadales bacterium]